MQLLYRFSERFRHAGDHPDDTSAFQSAECAQRILCLLLPDRVLGRPGLDGGHGTVGLLLPMAVYVLLRYPALAGCHLFYPDVLPVCQASCLFSF